MPATRRGKPGPELGGQERKPREPKPPAPAGLRALLAQVSEEEATLEAVRQLVRDALGSEKATKVSCPDCGTEFKAKLPDVKKNLDAAVAVLEQIEGRPKEAKPEAVKITIVRPPLKP